MTTRVQLRLPLVTLFTCLALASSIALEGCDNAAPAVLEAVVVSDTSVPAGPYEVRVLAADSDGIGPSELLWSVHGPLVQGAEGTAALSIVDRGTGSRASRLSALIPGQPFGTEVDWTVRVCDVASHCTADPADGSAFSFRVGIEPSAPALSSVSPDHGPASGGTRVEIEGTDLRPGVTVRFGNVPAASVEWLRTDLIAAVTASTVPGVVDVRVENTDGHAALLDGAFTFTPSPNIIGLAPAEGPEAGGTPLVILGNNFGPDARAFLGGVACRHLVVRRETEIDCETPPGRRGLVDVEVRADDGGRGVVRDGFEYIQAPLVDGVFPLDGSSDGGDTVTLTGDGFRDGAVVLIGGAVCTDVVVRSPTELSCTTPPGEPGAADIVVTNADGQSDTLPGGFGFIGPPVVVEVLPGLVPVAGGVEVRVLGAGLSDGDSITFGGAVGVVTGSVGSNEVRVLVPPVPAALSPAPLTGLLAVDVVVTRNEPRDTRSGGLTGGLIYFWPPEVTSVTPSRGPVDGGTAVVVNGRFFRPIDGEAFSVRFGDVECIDVQVLSSTSLSCTTPPHEGGLVDVAVENTPISIGDRAEAFFYIAPPRVDQTDPQEGPTFGGDGVVIRGAFFDVGALVFIDGAPCSDVQVLNGQTLTCVSPPGVEGNADVRVVNPDGLEGTGVSIYEYLGVAVTPNHGLPVGFAHVRVRSAGMHPDAVVLFDGVAADCVFVSEREIDCETPAHARGDVDVRFLNGDGTSETGTHAFHYRTYVGHSDDFPFDTENANDVDLADIDGDGDLDAVVATGRVNNPEQSAVWENDGHGVFTRHNLPDVFASANNVSIGDVNGDGKPDLLFGCTSGAGPILLAHSANSRLGFEPIQLNLGSNSDAFDAEIVDLVGDGRLDVYNLSSGCSPLDPSFPGCDPSTNGPDNLFEQRNGGLVDRSSTVPHDTGWTHDHKMNVLDIDGDGDNDIVIITNNEGILDTEENRVLENRVNEGLGFVRMQNQDALLNIFGDLYDIDVGDIDGDGDPDLITTVCGGDFGEVLLRNDNGTLVSDVSALPSLSAGSCTVGSAMVDVDDDGDLDLLFGGTRSLDDTRAQMRLFVNRGDGTFVDASDALPSFGNQRIQLDNFAAGDIDGDRDIDILIAGGAPYHEPDNAGRVVVLHLE